MVLTSDQVMLRMRMVLTSDQVMLRMRMGSYL